MTDAPEKSLTSCDAINSKPNGDAQRMRRVNKSRDQETASRWRWGFCNFTGNKRWVPSLECSVRTEVDADTNICKAKEGTGCKRDRPILV
jgi:hypothetical protein